MRRVWATSNDGKIRYESLTSDRLDGALKCMRGSFYKYETVSKNVGLPEHPEAITDLEELTLRTARDGVSLVAIDTTTDEVCSVLFNKIQIKNNEDEACYFENFANSCKYEQSKELVQYMKNADEKCNLFELCNVDCLLEIMFLSTLPEYGKRGIGYKLCEISLEIVKKLQAGENVKIPMDKEELPLEPIPKLAAALFTSELSQKIGRKLNFTIAYKESFHNYLKNVAPGTPEFTLEYKIIN